MSKKFWLGAVAFAMVSAMSIRSEAAILLSWNTNANLGTETSEPSVTNDLSISAAALTLGAGVTAAGNGNRFGGSSWFDAGNTVAGNTIGEAVTGNNFIEFTVAPLAGFQFSATSFDFIWDRSSTGPSAVAIRSSVDSFASDIGSVTGLLTGGTATTTLNTIPITGLNNIATATTFRAYGFNATATTGTGGFDTVTGTTTANVIFNGDVTAVPEPTSMALIGMFGVAGLAARYRRKNASSTVAV